MPRRQRVKHARDESPVTTAGGVATDAHTLGPGRPTARHARPWFRPSHRLRGFTVSAVLQSARSLSLDPCLIRRVGAVLSLLVFATMVTSFNVYVAGFHIGDEAPALALFAAWHAVHWRHFEVDYKALLRWATITLTMVLLVSVLSDYRTYSLAKSAQFLLALMCGALVGAIYLPRLTRAHRTAGIAVAGVLVLAGVGPLDIGFLRLVFVLGLVSALLWQCEHHRQVVRLLSIVFMAYLVAAQNSKAIWGAGLIVTVAALVYLRGGWRQRVASSAMVVIGILVWYQGDYLIQQVARLTVEESARPHGARTTIKSRVADIIQPEDSTSNVHRLSLMSTAMSAFSARPFTGVGVGAMNLRAAFERYYDPLFLDRLRERSVDPDHIPDLLAIENSEGRSPGTHSIYGDIAASGGILAIVAFLWFIWLIIRRERSPDMLMFAAAFLFAGLAWHYTSVAFGAFVMGMLGRSLIACRSLTGDEAEERAKTAIGAQRGRAGVLAGARRRPRSE